MLTPEDLEIRNADNEWSVGLILDGRGFHYTATRLGILWAGGWIRCEDGEDAARAIALDIGKLAQERAA